MSWSRLYDFVAGNPARSSEVDAELDQLITAVNTLLGIQIPIGSIIPFYDFDGALTFDTSQWVYCDGSTATVGGSSRTLPDLSGRYLVGFGGATDGAGDIDTATWATTPVGNALHQVDLSHTHTGPSHTHALSSAGYAAIGLRNELGYRMGRFAQRGSQAYTHMAANSTGQTWGASSGNNDIFAADLGGATDAGGTGATGSGGSATQSIQPRSIRVRFLMRKA